MRRRRERCAATAKATPDGKTLGLDGETPPLGLNYAGAEWVISGVVNASG